ncbi:MAG: hypothetical protein OEM67_11220 [Thermoleophilia bacterium]|nr:hypothetical protein [Thermoleophilia bacterium]MDH3725249.1 hypothetical protein [Thermoleophilia bacterium]
MRTSLPIAFVALMLSLALGGFVLFSTASAASSSARVQTTGTGRVVVHGQVVAFGLASGAGRIVVVDRRGDAQFTMNGRTRMQSLKGTRRKKRRVVIKNADGRFYARGSKISILIRSTQLNVSIAGRGNVRLKGIGRYTLNGSKAREWSRDPRRWRTVRLRPPTRR